MDAEPFEKHVSFRFQINDDWFLIEPDGRHLAIEELRKNGQEDCHMAGYLVRETDTTFEWSEGEFSFSRYGYKSLPEKILEYLNQHIDWIDQNICTE